MIRCNKRLFSNTYKVRSEMVNLNKFYNRFVNGFTGWPKAMQSSKIILERGIYWFEYNLTLKEYGGQAVSYLS